MWGEQSRQLLLLRTAGRQGVRAREPVVVSLWAFPGPGMVLLHQVKPLPANGSPWQATTGHVSRVSHWAPKTMPGNSELNTNWELRGEW